MKRFALIFLSIFIVILFSAVRVEQPSPKWSVGILAASHAKDGNIAGFKKGMDYLGFMEDKNISYTIMNANGNRDKLLSLAQQLIEEKPHVLVAAGGVEADVLKIATVNKNIPVVFIGVASTIERGLAKSLLEPGENITGVDNFHAELAGKRLELLKKLLPSVDRVLVIYDPEVPPSYQSLKIVGETAQLLKIEIGTIDISSHADLQSKLNSQSLRGYDAILPLSSFFIESIAHDLLDLSLKNGIPVMGIYGQEADEGFFAAYGVSRENQGHQGSRLVAKVLDGQPAEKIPVETPDNLDLIVNLRTVQKLGLKLDETGLSFAKVVIK